MTTYYSHTNDLGIDNWELLGAHLEEVGDMSGKFAAKFGQKALGYAMGKWHDIGKASLAFQNDVLKAKEGESKKVDHSTAGAKYAMEQFNGPPGCILAAGLAGHHAGLPDWMSSTGSGSDLINRLEKEIEEYHSSFNYSINEIAEKFGGIKEPNLSQDSKLTGFCFSFLARMLFSCLVDADSLCTERFCNPNVYQKRSKSPNLDHEKHICVFNDYMSKFVKDKTKKPSPVDITRSEIYEMCVEAANSPAGWFTLEVPTGGGKTLSSMRFCLDHAKVNGQERIIFALPFTSIIEQTAKLYKGIFGYSDVLEHHSNLDPKESSHKSKLSAENWDSPIVVTTNVQLFESLFSNRRSSCRKLHNIANSIIVLDEAQSVPAGLARPVIAVLDELVRNYNCTIVLCTATQPAFNKRPSFDIGIDPSRITRIVKDPEKLFEVMKRVEIEPLVKLEDDQLAQMLINEKSALCIVALKKHAVILSDLIKAKRDDVIHLSAGMCPAHRSSVISNIRQLLADDKPCLVVSTSVVEAGVDIDFPCVYKVISGFDSIAQAAGRANREGKMKGMGRVVLFETKHRAPRGMINGANVAKELLPDNPDVLSPKSIDNYFREFLFKNTGEGKYAWDAYDVMPCFGNFAAGDFSDAGYYQHNFREASSRFKWIQSITTSIVVPWGKKGAKVVDKLLSSSEPDFKLLREAQPYTISVYSNVLEKLTGNSLVTPGYTEEGCEPDYFLLKPEAYDSTTGVREDALPSAEHFVI